MFNDITKQIQKVMTQKRIKNKDNNKTIDSYMLPEWRLSMNNHIHVHIEPLLLNN